MVAITIKSPSWKGRVGIPYKLLAYNTRQIGRICPGSGRNFLFRQSASPFLGGSLVPIMTVSEIDFGEDALPEECTNFQVYLLFMKF